MAPYPVNPSWLYVGQTVFVAPALAGITGTKPGTGLQCKVLQAFGDAGIVANERYGFQRLVSRWDMWVKAGE